MSFHTLLMKVLPWSNMRESGRLQKWNTFAKKTIAVSLAVIVSVGIIQTRFVSQSTTWRIYLYQYP